MAVGWLIVEDIFTVILLVLIPVLGTLSTVIIDMNIDTIAALHAEGQSAIFGDGSNLGGRDLHRSG